MRGAIRSDWAFGSGLAVLLRVSLYPETHKGMGAFIGTRPAPRLERPFSSDSTRPAGYLCGVGVCHAFTSFVHRVTTQSIVPLYASSELNLTPKEVGLLFSISGFTVFAMILPAGF